MMHELRLLYNFALEIGKVSIFINLEKMNYFLISPLKQMHAIIFEITIIKQIIIFIFEFEFFFGVNCNEMINDFKKCV